MATLNESDLAAEVGQESGLNNSQAKLAVEKTFEAHRSAPGGRR